MCGKNKKINQNYQTLTSFNHHSNITLMITITHVESLVKYRLLSEPEIGNLLGNLSQQQQTENSNNAIGVSGNANSVGTNNAVNINTTDNSSSPAASLNGKKNNILRA